MGLCGIFGVALASVNGAYVPADTTPVQDGTLVFVPETCPVHSESSQPKDENGLAQTWRTGTLPQTEESWRTGTLPQTWRRGTLPQTYG